METMREDLKPCPFCNSKRISGVTVADPDRLFREFVCCGVCGASTTTYETKEEAVSAWNKRAYEK